MKLIMSADLNWNIGKGSDLLFRTKKDLSFFRKMTLNKTIIMGRKTYESLGVDALPQRKNVVFTSDLNYGKGKPIIVFNDKEKLLKFIRKEEKTGEVYLIGGASMIKEFLPWIDVAIITRFQEVRDANVRMLNLNDDYIHWKLISSTNFDDDVDQNGQTVVFRIETYLHT